jgi:hypothetical protein
MTSTPSVQGLWGRGAKPPPEPARRDQPRIAESVTVEGSLAVCSPGPVTPTGVAQREDTAVPVTAFTLGSSTTAIQETP